MHDLQLEPAEELKLTYLGSKEEARQWNKKRVATCRQVTALALPILGKHWAAPTHSSAWGVCA